jgi:hypothetical protein
MCTLPSTRPSSVRPGPRVQQHQPGDGGGRRCDGGQAASAGGLGGSQRTRLVEAPTTSPGTGGRGLVSGAAGVAHDDDRRRRPARRTRRSDDVDRASAGARGELLGERTSSTGAPPPAPGSGPRGGSSTSASWCDSRWARPPGRSSRAGRLLVTVATKSSARPAAAQSCGAVADSRRLPVTGSCRTRPRPRGPGPRGYRQGKGQSSDRYSCGHELGLSPCRPAGRTADVPVNKVLGRTP